MWDGLELLINIITEMAFPQVAAKWQMCSILRSLTYTLQLIMAMSLFFNFDLVGFQLDIMTYKKTLEM